MALTLNFDWPISLDDCTIPIRGEFGPRIDLPGNPAHDGIDMNAPEGTPVRASAAGVVSRVQSADDPNGDGEGNALWIDHADRMMTAYLHLAEMPAVEAGSYVERGDVIGEVGQTGNAEGPHLCFMCLTWGVPVNPRDYIQRGGVSWSQ